MACSKRFLSPSQKLGIIFTDNLRLTKSCQELQWNHRIHGPTEWHGEWSEERKEGATVALVQSGLSSLWCDCAMVYCCHLRTVQDKIAGSTTAFEVFWEKHLMDHIINSERRLSISRSPPKTSPRPISLDRTQKGFFCHVLGAVGI